MSGLNKKNDESKGPQALREEEILKFWREKGTFKKTENRGDKKFIFYDGPPFATGLPHYGHILAGTIKDAVPRYQVMQGRKLHRRWGWDCHGLPLENEIEKELGIEGKKEIEEKFGVRRFNEEARSRVLRYADRWKEIIPRMGRFVDMDDDYKTMDPSFTESVWWSFKTLYDKGLIYQGFKAMHLCPRCGTTLSNFEVNQGYKDISDLSVTVPFELIDEKKTYLLVWTTTPWTLPGNVATAVNPEFDYVKVSITGADYEGKKYILAKERLGVVLKDREYKILAEIKGKELVGKKYNPPFDYYVNEKIEHKENGWKIYAADFVTLNDGTGVVHEAPAYGEDDLVLAQKNNITVIHHVGVNGKFKNEVKDFAGLSVKPKDDKQEDIDHTDTDVEIIKYLAHNGKLFAKEKITHSYPHCWRCETPLLNYATTSWFVKVTAIKEKLVEENKKIKWVPETIGKYRFGNWLEGAHDWAISRARYWGAPLPVWQSEDLKERLVFGSLEDFKKHILTSGNSYFVMRHGEAESNVKNITSNHYKDKIHLTENGKKEIKKTAGELNGKKIDLIVSSDFIRTKETAGEVASLIGLAKEKIIFDERLREINTGDFSGKPNPDYHSYFGTIEEKFTKRPPNGENLTELKRRVMEFLYEIERKYKDKKILIVTHEYAVWMMFTGALGWSNKVSAEDKSRKEDFIETGEVLELPFVPLPHNPDYELDFHRPYIDEVILEKDGQKLTRIPEVFDCWYESGSMPYGEAHYPFNKNSFNPQENIGYPADFIAEGLDQTRGWFYSLLVLGVALFDRAPFRHVIVNGTILAEDGQKMSKRLKNYPDPIEIVDKYGADAMRYYLLSSPVSRGEDFNFSEKGVAEVANKIIGRLLNIYSFYELYAGNLYDASYKTLKENAWGSENILDKWILARLTEAIGEVTDGYENYELDQATRPIGIFIDDLSTWYLRRSRDRFKSDDAKDRELAQTVTHFVLLELSKVIAPVMPFTAEYIYQKLKSKDEQESVHLEQWPTVTHNQQPATHKELLEQMKAVRRVVTLALEQRAKASIKVRQPLGELRVKRYELRDKKELLELIKDEANVKEIVFDEKQEQEILLDLSVSESLKAEGDARGVIRAIQEARKEANLMPSDVINISVDAKKHIADAIIKWQEEIKKVTNASSLTVGIGELGGEDEFKITIEKV